MEEKYWWSNVREVGDGKFKELVKRSDFKKNGKKEIEVVVELKGDYVIMLGLSLN